MSAAGNALDQNQALPTFEAYVKAFEKLEPESMRSFYHEPCLMISPLGVTALTTGNDVVGSFQRTMADLKNRGYQRTAFARISERPLGPSLCLITGVGTWYKADGSVLQKFGAMYAFQKTEANAWRIAVAIFHDPATA